MHQIDDFLETKRLMQRLWPKWKADEELGRLLNERWGQLRQDKLRDAVRQHRLVRNVTPDITAIHKEYCKISGEDAGTHERNHELRRTQCAREEWAGPSPAEREADERWARDMLATATEAEIREVRESVGLQLKNELWLAVAIDLHRRGTVGSR
jgi:hypothetical protein